MLILINFTAYDLDLFDIGELFFSFAIYSSEDKLTLFDSAEVKLVIIDSCSAKLSSSERDSIENLSFFCLDCRFI